MNPPSSCSSMHGISRAPAPGCCITPMMKPGGRRGLNPAGVTLGEFWCRAVGWYGMALVHALEHLRTHAQHAQLLSILAALASGLGLRKRSLVPGHGQKRFGRELDRDLLLQHARSHPAARPRSGLLACAILGRGAKGSSGRSESGLRGCRWGGAGRGHLCWDERRHHRFLPPAAHGYERSSWSWRIPASA